VRGAKTLNTVAILLTVLMLAAWGLLAFDLYGIVSSGPPIGGEDRYSRAWDVLFAYGLTAVVWLFLIILFQSKRIPGGFVVWMVSAAAAVGAYYLFDSGKTPWPAAIPLALPLLLAGAVLSGHWSALRTPLLAIAAIPCLIAAGAFAYAWMGQASWESAERAEVRTQNLALVAQIAESQPLWHWLPLLKDDSGVRDETIAALRKLNRRQADIEQMVAEGVANTMDLIPLLDLQPTPRLQELINASLLKDAAYARTKPGGGDEILKGDFMFSTLPALHWMHDHGGCCREGISRMKAAALEYRGTKVRASYLKELDGLLQ
jgi:hypothetical protein